MQITFRNLFLLILVCALKCAFPVEGKITLKGTGSGQIIPPNTCTPQPLVAQLNPPAVGLDQPIRFTLISVPPGAEGCRILLSPEGEGGSQDSLDRLPSAAGEARVWVRAGDKEGAYILTAEHPLAENVVTFFVHARRKIWLYLVPLPVLVGLVLVIWGLRNRAGSQ